MMEFDSLSLRDYDFSQHRFGGCQIDPEFEGSLILINKRRKKKVGQPEIVINQNDSEFRPELNRLNPLDKEYAVYLFDKKEINKLNFITFCLRKLL